MFESERAKPAPSNDRARKLTSNLICMLPRMTVVSTQAFSSMQPSASQSFCVAAPLETFLNLRRISKNNLLMTYTIKILFIDETAKRNMDNLM